MMKFNTTKKIGLATMFAGSAVALSLLGAGAASADTEEFDMKSGGMFVPTMPDVFPVNFDVKDHPMFTVGGNLHNVKDHPLFEANGHALFTVKGS